MCVQEDEAAGRRRHQGRPFSSPGSRRCKGRAVRLPCAAVACCRITSFRRLLQLELCSLIRVRVCECVRRISASRRTEVNRRSMRPLQCDPTVWAAIHLAVVLKAGSDQKQGSACVSLLLHHLCLSARGCTVGSILNTFAARSL